MKKNEIIYKSQVVRYADFGEYIVELTNDFLTEFNYTEIWLYNKEYGVKMHCIGINDVEQEFIDEYILANVQDWIDTYKIDYEN